MMQQLIMSWADNFTSPDAKHVGFVDDDTLFTKDITPYDLFDQVTGKPRAIVKYMSEASGRYTWVHSWYKWGYEAFGSKKGVLINGMSYFPVVIHRDHFPQIREAIMQAHRPPREREHQEQRSLVLQTVETKQAIAEAKASRRNVTYFDQWYLNLLHSGLDNRFSQFMIMLQFAWDYQDPDTHEHTYRQEYSWHFEASIYNSATNIANDETAMALALNGTNQVNIPKLPYVANAVPKGKADKKWKYLAVGSPLENGVTVDMLRPFPRCAMHASYMSGNKRVNGDPAARSGMVSNIMKSGFCWSLPIETITTTNSTMTSQYDPYVQHCRNKKGLLKNVDVMNDYNGPLEWHFEVSSYGVLWPYYDPEGTLLAHQERMRRNQPREWDLQELERLMQLRKN